MEKNLNKNGNYNIGLDIGTNSIGFAVTNLDGELIKVKGKNFWGVRLFEEGKTAVVRRNYRSARRRKSRRKFRLDILKDIFANEVNLIDPNFFEKLNDSYKHKSERHNKYNIFDDNEFNDKIYYEKFPTIYHLRKHLVESKNKEDIRLVYLALHNIIKYRGNFLYEGQNFGKQESNIEENLESLLMLLNDIYDGGITYSTEDLKKFISFMEDPKQFKSDKLKKLIIESKDKDINRALKEINKALLGNTFDFKVLLNLDDQEEKIEVNFSKDIDEDAILANLVGNEEIFNLLNKIYNALILKKISGDHQYISDGMIERYNKHKKDLNILKTFIKKYYPESYNDIFRNNKNEKISNYVNYIANPGANSRESFYKYLLNIIDAKGITDELYDYIKFEISNDTFLRVLNIKDNSVIPFQLHLAELDMIIENQKLYYPFLEDNKEKITSLLTFRIPYYVGPLNKKSQFAWLEFKSNEKVRPWNFFNVVDIEKSAENFIVKMRNKCTYLIEEDVLPKNSLLIKEYELLDELNKIRINDKLILRETKEKLIEKIFKKTKKVTINRVELFLKSELNLTNIEIQGTRKDNEFAGNLSSYIDFNNIFGNVNESNINMIEEIILWITLFSDKKILENKIKNTYPEITEDQMKKILKLNYSGWSRLSRELLDGLKTKTSDGNETIISLMRKTNQNFMQIINDDKYNFKKFLSEINMRDLSTGITIDDIKEFIKIPSLRKATWQTLLIIEEIIYVMKKEPCNIFLEVTRSDQPKLKTKSRIDKLLKLYEVIKEDATNYNKSVHDELKNIKKDNRNLDSEKLFLYFIQNGKSMYSDTRLSIDNLSEYEVDHILPRSLIKDDSIENKVLVTKTDNQNKGDSLLLNREIIRKQEGYWRYLHSVGLIGSKKLYNLLRTEFNENEIEKFIARQYVETSQIIKNVAELLVSRYKGVGVVLVKSQLTASLRQKLDLYKIRELNDFHHAHDALITSHLGYFCKEYLKMHKYGEFKRYRNKVTSGGWVIDKFIDLHQDTGEVLWNGPKYISTIKESFNYKDYFITKKTEEQKGEFYNQTIEKKSAKRINIKKHMNPELYGGYTNLNECYGLLVKVEDKKGQSFKLVSVSRLEDSLLKHDRNAFNNAISKKLGTNNFEIVRKILKYQYVIHNGHPVYIASMNEVNNAKQLYVDKKYQKIMYDIIKKKVEDNEENNKILIELYDHINKKIGDEYPLFASIHNKFNLARDGFINLEVSEKAEFIEQMIKITSPAAVNGNFQKFNIKPLTSREGRLNIKVNPNNLLIIDKSITGVFEKVSKYEF